MPFTREQLRRFFPKASTDTIALNVGHPDHHTQKPQGGTDPSSGSPKLERADEHGALRPRQDKARDPRRFLVRVTSVRNRLLDEDNLCEKYHVDCCRYSGLIPGDSPRQTKIEPSQRQTQKGEPEHTIVEIFILGSEAGTPSNDPIQAEIDELTYRIQKLQEKQSTLQIDDQRPSI